MRPRKIRRVIRKRSRSKTSRLLRFSLTANGGGRWCDELGEAVSRFDGCLDVDITATPFTNTLPIRQIENCSRNRMRIKWLNPTPFPQSF
ncbi:MAG: putative glycolipid-binding domain-containing protein [Pyrinomonadaceae bacterium]